MLHEIKEISFKLEKDIELLLNENLETLFCCSFLQNQFALDSFIFDAIAFNMTENSFVIIEYKKVSNSSLVDQGYSYMATLLNRKADVVLLYNQKNHTYKTVQDFDWTQTRMIFISPKFTEKQKIATSFADMPFELYEVHKYENNLISIESISKNENISIKDVAKPIKQGDKGDIATVNKEVAVYTEKDHVLKADENIADLYEKLKAEILAWENVRIEAKKLYVSFKRHTNFVDIEIQKKALKMTVNMVKGSIVNFDEIITDCSAKGKWGNGDYQMKIENDDKIEYVLSIIKESWKKN